MSLKCPSCNRRISRWQLISFFRLFSISCPECRTLLALDGRGRTAFFGSILASIPLAALLAQFIESEVAVVAAVATGFAFGAVASTKLGRLGVSAETSTRQEKN